VFYFIPVSSSEMLFDMGFLHFWMDQGRYHKNKRQIVLLEDAEELLLPRDDGNRDKVSNMLNLADGFIGDHLRLHVIATTNAPVRKLDEAIQRPGRLIGAREFRRLTRAEAQRLAQAKGLTLPDQDDFSLAEIYNGAAVSTNFSSERRVGFAG
jgi:SpoVK/Ycf46/Vps4 family AAA+-type ATPase